MNPAALLLVMRNPWCCAKCGVWRGRKTFRASWCTPRFSVPPSFPIFPASQKIVEISISIQIFQAKNQTPIPPSLICARSIHGSSPISQLDGQPYKYQQQRLRDPIEDPARWCASSSFTSRSFCARQTSSHTSKTTTTATSSSADGT